MTPAPMALDENSSPDASNYGEDRLPFRKRPARVSCACVLLTGCWVGGAYLVLMSLITMVMPATPPTPTMLQHYESQSPSVPISSPPPAASILHSEVAQPKPRLLPPSPSRPPLQEHPPPPSLVRTSPPPPSAQEPSPASSPPSRSPSPAPPALSTAVLHQGHDCWSSCGGAGVCPLFCGFGGACCKQGADGANWDCGRGALGCTGIHCCSERANFADRCAEVTLSSHEDGRSLSLILALCFTRSLGPSRIRPISLCLRPRAPPSHRGRTPPSMPSTSRSRTRTSCPSRASASRSPTCTRPSPATWTRAPAAPPRATSSSMASGGDHRSHRHRNPHSCLPVACALHSACNRLG